MVLAGVMHVIVTAKATLLGHRRKVACSMPEFSWTLHNPSAFAGLGMLANANRTNEVPTTERRTATNVFAIENSMKIRRKECDYFNRP